MKQYIEEGKGIDVDNETIPLAALTIRRYKSEDGQVFVATDTYFKESKRDYTKYIFLGEEHNKRNLVLRVTQEFVRKNPNTSLEELRKTFSEKIFLITGNSFFLLREWMKKKGFVILLNQEKSLNCKG